MRPIFYKTFYKGLSGKKGKLNLITSTAANKYTVVRSFGPSSIVVCSEKSSIITQSFESYSELVSIQSRNESTSEEISVNELEEPSEYSLQVGVLITI